MGRYDEAFAAKIYDAGLQVYNVMNPLFAGGAKGDGVTTEDAVINDVLARIPAAGGGVILFPPGRTYVINAVVLNKPGVVIWAYGATLKKAATTAQHMFRDTAAAADGLRVLGGTWDMNRAAFTGGQTVSPFFLVRTNNLIFRDMRVKDGIEEGLKLYKCQRVRVLVCEFDNIRNNGVQIHAPATDGFTGTRPNQDAADIAIIGCRMRGIDDGLDGTGDGTAVAMNSTDTVVGVRDVLVSGCTIEDCIRGPWAEFNTAGKPGRNIVITNNRIRLSEVHGIGMLGVEDGAAVGNVLQDIGKIVPNPPATASEVFAIKLGGSADPKSQGVVVADNAIVETRTGASQYMEYGVIVDQARDCVVRNNTIVGAKTRRLWAVNWANITNSEIEDIAAPQCRVKLASSFVLATATWTNVPWNGEDWDDPNDPMHSTTTNPERVLLKWPGRYEVKAGFSWPANATGIRLLRVRLDDGVSSTVEAEEMRAATSGDDTSVTVNCEFAVSATNKFVRVEVYQNSGAGMTIAPANRIFCVVRRVSGQV